MLDTSPLQRWVGPLNRPLRAAGVAVLDVIYVLAVVALFVLVGVIARAVEKL
jgi:hypothetical protein